MLESEKPKINLPTKDLGIQPLTKQEIHDTAVERVHLISKEFTDGFNFLRNYPKSVTIFGGNLIKEDNPYYIKARNLGHRIATELKYAIFTGGGPGIMEAANRGAFEAGGESVGLNVELPHHQVQNPYINRYLNFHYFFSRKVCLGFSAESYIFFPGGFGTFDEFFEIITLVQTGKIEKVPIILVGKEFWKHLDELMRKEMLSRGMIDAEDLTLYTIIDDEDEILKIIRNTPVRNGIGFSYSHNDLEKHGIVIEPGDGRIIKYD
ncbi:MAG TPA: TIGR00730 family Rossman fold protein [Candidatus Paceibacterota bacterium]